MVEARIAKWLRRRTRIVITIITVMKRFMGYAEIIGSNPITSNFFRSFLSKEGYFTFLPPPLSLARLIRFLLERLCAIIIAQLLCNYWNIILTNSCFKCSLGRRSG